MLNMLTTLIDDAIASSAAMLAIDDYETIRDEYPNYTHADRIDIIDDNAHDFAYDLILSTFDNSIIDPELTIADPNAQLIHNRFMRSYDATIAICSFNELRHTPRNDSQRIS